MKSEFIIKHPIVGFYAPHCRGNYSEEFPDTKIFTSLALAKAVARSLTCGDSLWAQTAIVWENYGYANERMVGDATEGRWTSYSVFGG